MISEGVVPSISRSVLSTSIGPAVCRAKHALKVEVPRSAVDMPRGTTLLLAYF
jgi:hypothetical protein